MIVKKTLGHYKRKLESLYREVYANYLMTGDQIGDIGNDDWYENDSDSRNSLKMMLHVGDEEAKAVMNLLKQVKLSCQENPEQSCIYHLLRHNCVDVMQEVFKQAGGSGYFVDYFTDEQLNYGHLNTPSKLFEFKAAEYGLIKSRGLQRYLKMNFQKIWNVQDESNPNGDQKNSAFVESNELSEHFFHPFQTAENGTSSALNESYSLSKPIPEQGKRVFNAPIGEQFVFSDVFKLGVVIGKIAVNTFGFLSDLWCKSIGDKATKEEFSEWHQYEKNRLIDLSTQLEDMDAIVDEQVKEIEDLILELESAGEIDDGHPQIIDRDGIHNSGNFLNLKLFREVNSKWKKLSHQIIDARMDAIELKEELNRLKRSFGLLTKAYLERIGEKINQKVSFVDELSKQVGLLFLS
jgi:hypothetical protein